MTVSTSPASAASQTQQHGEPLLSVRGLK
ncbi:MAG: hypothetical protein ACI9X4_001471, partial [Glaciecola sp.]